MLYRFKASFWPFVWAMGSLPVWADTHSLTVTITDIKALTGTLHVALFKHPCDYERKTNALGRSVPVTAAEISVQFSALPEGEVVVLLYQDKNDNGQLDTNLLGIPTEPYASSTGRRGRFGPPSWNRGKFHIDADAHLKISLR